MKDSDSIDHFPGQLTGMSVRYGNLGGSLDDQALVKKLFDTVPEKFIQVVAGIEQFYDLKKLSFADAVGRLKAFEERVGRNSHGAVKSEPGQVLLTQAEWEARQKRSSGEGSSKTKSHDGGGGSRGRGRGRGGSSGGRGGQGDGSAKKDKSHIKCFKCHQNGHYANKCPGAEKKKEDEAHHARAEFEATVLLAETAELGLQKNLLSEDCQETVLLNEVKVMPELYFTGSGQSCGDTWYLDNGASNHMTGDLQKFRSIDMSVSGKVRFGDGSTVEIQGKGSILFQGNSGDQWILNDVYYIPKLKSNLVSLGQLTEIGHRVVMDDDVLEVTEKNSLRMIMNVQRLGNRLYMIELNPVEPKCFLSSINDQSWLWHGRLGHVNFKSMRMLVEKEMAGGLPLIEHPDQVCESCLAAKQTRVHFPKSSVWRADEPLELLHIDLCGPYHT